MQGSGRNRNLIWIIAAGMLAILLILIFTHPWSTLARETRSINLPKTDKVDRITISNKHDTTMLSRVDSLWKVSGTETANHVAVENLLFVASRLTIISIVSAEELNVDWERTSVAYFHKNREILKYDLYYDGKRYMVLLPGSDNFFVVKLAGYEAIRLSGVFSPLTNHYRKQHMIALLPGEISFLSVTIPGKSHFTIKQDSAGLCEIFDHINQRVVPPDLLNDHKIRMLLSYFTDIRFEETFGSSDAASLRKFMAGEMLAKIVVGSRDGESYSMEVYPLLKEQGETTDMFRSLVIFNDQPTPLVVNYIYLDVLMRDLAHYYL